MQEPQHTSTSNNYHNVVSVLYHALQAGQTCETYIQDAKQAGNQQAEQFFREAQQNANQCAEKAKSLLDQLRSER
jgi:hypothetical protein